VLGHGRSDSPSGVELFFSAKPKPRMTIAKILKKKALFSLPDGVINDLDRMWLELRMQKKMIDKSGIVALAIQHLFDDYKKNKENSIIFKSR